MLQRVLEPEAMDTPEEAADYDAMDHSGPNEAFVARLIELRAAGRMLDIGTGPGHIPLMVIDRIADAWVLGIDLAGHMLAIAERHRKRHPRRERVAFEKVDAKALPYDDHTFDCVFSNTILHHIPDPTPLLREACRVLKPGGALLVRDLFRPDDIDAVNRLVATHAGDANAHQQKLFRDSLIAALTPDELRGMAREAGLADVELVIDTDRHMSLQRAAAPAG